MGRLSKMIDGTGVNSMKWPILAITLMLLAGCKDPVKDAREKMRFLQANGGTLGEVCDAGRELLKAKVDARDTRSPEDRSIVDVNCMTVEMKGRDMPSNQDDPIYSMEPDNMDAIADTTSLNQ